MVFRASSRFSSEYVNRGEPQINEAIKDCDLTHLHNPMVEGMACQKTRIPCVMTIYNWRREGLHPRLLASVGPPVRQTEDGTSPSLSGILGRANARREAPVFPSCPRCRRARLLLRRKKGLSLCWKMGSQQGAANPAQGLPSTRPEPRLLAFDFAWRRTASAGS